MMKTTKTKRGPLHTQGHIPPGFRPAPLTPAPIRALCRSLQVPSEGGVKAAVGCRPLALHREERGQQLAG